MMTTTSAPAKSSNPVPPLTLLVELVIPDACMTSSATDSAKPGTRSMRMISSAIPAIVAR